MNPEFDSLDLWSIQTTPMTPHPAPETRMPELELDDVLVDVREGELVDA